MGADILVSECAGLRASETALIVCDPQTRDVAELVRERASQVTPETKLVEIPPLRMHGEEPPPEVSERMARSDVCFGLTTKSMAHTRARQRAAASGGRYLSLPDYSLELLADGSLRTDFRERAAIARRFADAFTAGSVVRVTAPGGTDISMRIDGRTGNCAPGFVRGPGELGSPPDVEANVSPLEDSADGIVIVDGSIPYPSLGLVRSPVRVRVRGGVISDLAGDGDMVRELEALFASADEHKTRVLAECGVGLNDRARLTGVMLTDEGAFGTMHFGFGSNATVGGVNDVPFHLDMVFRAPTLAVDARALLSEGRLVEATPV